MTHRSTSTGTNSWSALTDWNLIDTATVATGRANGTFIDGTTAAAALTATNATTDAEEFDLWIDGNIAGAATFEDPGCW